MPSVLASSGASNIDDILIAVALMQVANLLLGRSRIGKVRPARCDNGDDDASHYRGQSERQDDMPSHAASIPN